MDRDDDLELLKAWQGGDDVAGERLFRRHYRAVLRFFHNKAGPQAPDLVQRTFLGCLEARARIRGETGFRAFLFGVARNVLYDHYRIARRDRDHDGGEVVSVEDLRPTPTSIFAAAREVELLLRGLRRIPIEGQIILEMYYWEGMRAREIADALEIPENTVRTKIRRARLRLEEVIAELTTSPDLRQSTIEGIETWAGRIRDVIGS
ncbi:MAG: sigma-70 family RNA polymerase sigma factor [Myxococcales bacterium]|nr:sigma-70 family RNA polymerase sigma factor [Myxococcales bacterium]MCB9702458.1 sigma-70 family RNA polymerase sigma factor [Myxococcales bacterium]